MYEVKYKVKATKIHSNHPSFIDEWMKDMPNHYETVQQNLHIFEILRKDASFNQADNSAEVVVLFDTKQEILDYTRWTYGTLYGLQVDKMTYNDIQFEQFIMNTDVTILDGKYTASVVSITEVGI